MPIFFRVWSNDSARSLPCSRDNISSGCLALRINEQKANIAVYGREDDGVLVNNEHAYHAWVECDGWLIDFMAPIMGVALREDGYDWPVPRRMLQKRLTDGKASIEEIQHVGEFFISHDSSLTESLIDSQPIQFADLLKVCLAWFRRPPKSLKDIALADSHGSMKTLVVRAPSIDGIW